MSVQLSRGHAPQASCPSFLQRLRVDFQYKRRDFCRGEVEQAPPSLFWLTLSTHTPPQSFPCHLPAAALCTSHRGSLAQRGLPGKCFGFHFRLQVIFKPAQFPAPCESQWGSVREAKDPVLSSRKNSILVRKTRPHQRNVPNKHPKINSAPPKLFLLVQGLCEKV